MMDACAICHQTKVSALSQEVMRRMSRFDLETEQEDRVMRMNNPKVVGERERRMKKFTGKTNWFREGGSKQGEFTRSDGHTIVQLLGNLWKLSCSFPTLQ